MEVSKLNDLSIKIKAKTATLITDPVSKTDADIVLFTTPSDSYVLPPDAKLVVEGPGEYEVNGVSVKAEVQNGALVFNIFDDQCRILLVPSTVSQKLKDEEGFDAVIVKATGTIDDTIMSSSAADTLILYGDEKEMKLNNQEIKRMPKVNLKKKEDVKGFAIYLGA